MAVRCGAHAPAADSAVSVEAGVGAGAVQDQVRHRHILEAAAATAAATAATAATAAACGRRWSGGRGRGAGAGQRRRFIRTPPPNFFRFPSSSSSIGSGAEGERQDVRKGTGVVPQRERSLVLGGHR